MLAATWKMSESSFYLSERVVYYVGKVCSCVPGDPESNGVRTVPFLETSDITNPASRSSCLQHVKRLLSDSLATSRDQLYHPEIDGNFCVCKKTPMSVFFCKRQPAAEVFSNDNCPQSQHSPHALLGSLNLIFTHSLALALCTQRQRQRAI